MGTQHKMLVVATPRFHDSTLLRRPSATIDFAPIQLAVTTSVATFYSIPPPLDQKVHYYDLTYFSLQYSIP
jgi:hypothetical protein